MSFNLSRTQFLQMFAVMQSIEADKQPYSKSNSACTFVEKRKHQRQPVLGINQSIVIDSFDAELG